MLGWRMGIGIIMGCEREAEKQIGEGELGWANFW